MTADCFLDANILLYAHSAATADRPKRQRARELILETRFGLSGQVLQEFIANALKKKELGIGEDNLDAVLEMAALVPVVAVSRELILRATMLRREFRVSPWDASILAAAQELQCPTLYSEDLQHGQSYGGVRVVNPFRGDTER